MFDNISVRAGRKAIKVIRDEGLDLKKVKVLAGASGSAKFLVLTGIDRVLMSLFKDRKEPLHLVGTSIGAFRMAAHCQKDPLEAFAILEEKYIAQQYGIETTREDIARETRNIINAYISDDDIKDIIQHPSMRISFLSNKCKGLMKKENKLFQMAGLGMAWGCNWFNRDNLGYFFERALFCNTNQKPPFSNMNQFPIHCHNLSPSNFKTALVSSGSIPLAMPGVCNIPGIPGVFRDGGIVDYHLDIPFLPQDDGFALYPHFYEQITPGWFDKSLNRKPDESNMENVVLVAPSKKFVASLPFQKIPDRNDFKTFHLKDIERREYWEKVLEMNTILGDEFVEGVESKRIRHKVEPI